MSYILDALKKSQSEQASDGVALRVQQTTKRTQPSWLVIGLGLVLLSNVGLLLWIFVLGPNASSAGPKVEQATIGVQTPVDQPVTDIRQDQPMASRANTQVPRGVVPRNQEASIEPAQVLSSESGQSGQSTRQSRAELARPIIAKFALSDLPAIEQSIYNGFTYTSHIYTDDPTLCAIVVDGQRLMAGDSFKGLGVVAITEEGVIFEENPFGVEEGDGVRRQVEISVLQQWEK